MPTSTYTSLANATLTVAGSSVTFSSIPSTYRDLILVIVGKGSATITCKLVINADNGSNYFHTRMTGHGSTTSTVFPVAQTGVILSTIATGTTTSPLQVHVDILDYTQTNKHKTIISRANAVYTGVEAFSNRWVNTAAITSLQISAVGGNWAIGSTFALYGIAG